MASQPKKRRNFLRGIFGETSKSPASSGLAEHTPQSNRKQTASPKPEHPSETQQPSTSRSEKGSVKRRLGLKQVFPDPKDAPSSKDIDIVAIHGLDTHSPKTWAAWKTDGDPNSGEVHWLQDTEMLPSVMHDARIFTYDWNANYDQDAATLGLFNHADALLEDLKNERREALIKASHSYSEYTNILKSTIGLVFLGTPFQGSDRGFFDAVQLRLAVAISTNDDVSGELVKYLDNDHDNRMPLDEVVQDFCTVYQNFKIPITCFFETQPTDFRKITTTLPRGFDAQLDKNRKGILVPQYSACLQGAKRMHIDVRHSMLNKFASVEDVGFKRVSGCLRDIADKVEEKQRNEPSIADDKREALLHALIQGTGAYTKYKDLNQERVPGTCEWFLTDRRFHKWRDDPSSSLLWVSAGPGYGKSVLSKFLIDDKQLFARVTEASPVPSSVKFTMGTQPTVCFFFFKDQVDDCTNSTNALCAILHQLFTNTSTSGLIKYAIKSHQEYGPKLTTDFSELWRILLNCITSPDAGEIICVLDALDECKKESRQEIIQKLKKFCFQSEKKSTSSSKPKFLVTSRPYHDLEKSFRKFQSVATYLRFDGHEKSHQIQQEIDLVIDFKLKSITEGFPVEDQQKISDHLKSMDHRTYLWLYLTLDIIENSPNFARPADIEDLLSQLPSQVSDAYETILTRNTDQSRAEILLQIMLAAQRPLTLCEANTALSIAIKNQAPKEYTDIKLWPENRFPSSVTNLCGLFITVYDTKLFFIHQTAREFLLHSEKKGNWQGRFNMQQSHSTISRTCLLYLLLPDIERLLTDGAVQNRQRDYLAYAASYWPLHFVSQQTDDANIFRDHAHTLCTAKHQASIWVPRYFEQRYRNGENWSDLALASYLGIFEVVQDIFKEKPQVNIEAKDEDGLTPLLLAIINGHEAIIELLLKERANIEAKDEDGRTPLLLAVIYEHEAIIELLLKERANIEARDEDGRTPLLLAVIHEHEAIIELLLKERADIEARDEDGRTPLLLAVIYEHEAIIELLLKERADIEARDEDGRTPLLLAIIHEHKAIVELLLKKGADIEARDEDGRTPLSLAIIYMEGAEGDEAIVELLLNEGAKMEAEDKRLLREI